MKCSIKECENTATRTGLCNNHYQRKWRNGTTETLRTFSLYVKDDKTGEIKRKCSKCGKIKSLLEFNKKGDGHQPNCKECRSKFPSAKPENHALTNKLWRERNKEKIKLKASMDYIKERDALKNEWLNAYGRKCTCCGESEIKFLTIEHLNGDGKNHRKEVGTGLNMLKDLKKQGFPKDKYTILCYNCNSGKSINKGICPHKEQKKKH